MNNFTKSSGNAYWHAVTNLTCCGIDLKKMQSHALKAFLVLMLFAFNSTSLFAQSKTTFYEVCMADRPEGLTPEQALALFPDADTYECKFEEDGKPVDGFVGVDVSEDLQGTDCGWVTIYTYYLLCSQDEDFDYETDTILAEQKIIYEGGDVTPPEMEIPADVTVECDAIPAVGTPTATDNCDDDVEITYDGEVRIGENDCSYTLQRTWTATDNCENSTTLTQTITVQDTQGPELNKGAVVPTGETGLNVCYSNLPEGPSEEEIASLFSDNCNGVNVVKEPVFKGTDCMWKGYINYYVTDNCGNPGDTISLYYNGGDTEAPVFVDAPEDIEVDCIDQIPANYVLQWTDNCSVSDPKGKGLGVDDTSGLGEACEGGVMTRTWTAQDACGNEVTHTQTITVKPAPPVVFDQLDDLTIKCDELDQFVPGILHYSNGGSGACDISGDAQGVAEEFKDNCGSFTVTYTYEDTCNSISHVQTITVVDEVAPDLVIPADVTVECDAVPAEDPDAASATDNCDQDVEVKYEGETRTDGQCPDSYTLTRTWTATDNCGNATTLSQTITVQDTTKPELTIPADVTVECDAVPPVGEATATDNCDAEVSVVFVDEKREDGNCENSYTLIRIWTATDNCGNSTTASQQITVQDTKAPELTIPADETVECDAVPAVGQASATDNCDEEVTVTYDGEKRTDGDCENSYTLTRTWTATDNCDNSTTLSQTITVQDTKAPDLKVPEDVTVECDSVPQPGEATATDNCDDQVAITYDGEKRTDGDCDDNYTLTRTWTATDNCGNSTTLSQTITVQDTTNPVITVPQDITVQCSEVPDNGVATATDNCDADVEVDFLKEERIDGECEDSYKLVRVWIATDNCGNYVTGSQTITVVDTTAPVFAGVGDDAKIECPESPVFSNPTASDNCDADVTITFEDNDQTDDCGLGSITRTWTATDNCGNSATASQTITIEDNVAPVIENVGDDYTVECPASPVFSEPTVKDECDDKPSLEFVDTPNLDDCGLGTITRTWTATDCAGNQSSASQTITIDDTVAPTINGVGDDFTVECPEDYKFSEPTASDDCDQQPELRYEDTSNLDDCGLGTHTRTWYATDCKGNQSTASQTITVVDTTAPVISGVEADYTVECPDSPKFSEPTVSDTCDQQASLTFADEDKTDDCGLGQITRTWTATDCTGNTSEASQTITIVDTTAPEINGVGEDFTVECPEGYEFSEPTAKDTCDDANGVSGFVGDFAPQNWQIDLGGGNGNVVINETTMTVTGNDTDDTIVTKATSTCPTTGYYSFDWDFNTTDVDGAAYDPAFYINGNLVQLTDDGGPDNQSGSKEVYCAAGDVIGFAIRNDVGALGSATMVVSNFNVGGKTVSLTYEDTDTLDECGLGTVTRTWTATDCAGNTSTASQTVTIQDTTAPVITEVGDDMTIDCPDQPKFSEPKVSDTCDADPKLEYVDEDLRDECGLGPVTRTWTATDCAGNTSTASQTITVQDVTDPYFNEELPKDVTEECDAVTPAATLTASDTCDTDVPVEFKEEKIDGNCDGNYTLVRTWTAADCAGNTIEHVQTVTVQDTTPPVQIGEIPESINEISGCASEAPEPMSTDDFAKLFEDNCSGVVVTLWSSPVGDDCGWSVMHKYTVSDGCGNLLGDFKVYYSGSDETSPELVGVPADTEIACTDAIPAPADVTATDNCDPNVKVHMDETIVDGNCAGNYDIIRTWTAEDKCGNPVSATQTIKVRDYEAPVLVGVLPEGSNENDLCAPDTDDELANLGVLTEAEFAQLYKDDCSGVNVQRTINLDGNDCKWIMWVRYEITDDCGNEAQPVKIWYHGADISAPETTGLCDNETMEILTSEYGVCPADATISVQVGDEISAANPNWTVGGREFSFDGLIPCFTDNCTAPEDLIFSVAGIDTGSDKDCPRTMTITFDVSDKCGNAYKGFVCTFVIIDDVAPTFDAEVPPYQVLVECGDDLPDYDVKASDNCDDNVEVTYKESPCDDATHNHGQTQGCYIDCIKRTWTATDDCGNTATTSQYALIIDTTPPVIECAGGDFDNPVDLGFVDNPVASEDDVFAYMINELLEPSISDSCTNAYGSGAIGFTVDDFDNQGNVSLYLFAAYSAVDDCGNVSEGCASVWYVTFPTPQVLSPLFGGVCSKEIDIETGDTIQETSCGNQAQAAPDQTDKGVALDFTAYPVPFDRDVNVKFNFEFDTDVTIEVHDTKGLLVKSLTLNGIKKGADVTRSFDLSRAGDQVFYITVTTNKGSVTKKVVSSNMKRY